MKYRRVHLDFHTSEKIGMVGGRFDKTQFQHALQVGHVDSITLFAKCHHGWMYYPSEKFPVHPNLTINLLQEQRDAAKEINVSTGIYLSAGFDEQMAVKQPDWLAHDEDNHIVCTPSFTKPGFHLFCYNTPYLDYLLSQIEEALMLFKTDELFLDISSVQPCYCPFCIQALKNEGKSVLDRAAVTELAERTYFRYTHAVQEVISRVSPGTTVFHNGGHILRGRRDILEQNTRLELESLPTSPLWGYDHFPLSAAYIRSMGKEFVGMTGRFHESWGEFGGYKHRNALRFETALTLANGGGCSIGDQLHPSGEMDMATYDLMGTAYREVENKEDWCKESKFLADIAVLSYESLGTDEVGRSSVAQNTDAGVIRMLMEGNYLFNVVDTEADFTRYKVLVLPDRERLSPALAEKTQAFVRQNGQVLASGLSGLAIDGDEFVLNVGAVFGKPSEYSPVYIEPCVPLASLPKAKFVVYSPQYMVESDHLLAKMYFPYFNRTADHFCSHQQAPAQLESAGAGITQGPDGIYFTWEVFGEYFREGSLCNKEMVLAALDSLLGEGKTIQTDFPAQGMVTLAKREKFRDYVLHAVYASPVKRGNIEIIEDVIPLHNQHFSLKLAEDIDRVKLVPSGEVIPFTKNDGRVEFYIPEIICHQMVELQYQ